MGARLPRLLKQAFALILSICASSAFEITGASEGINPVSGTLPSRFEISSLSQSGAAWDLFILSLYEIQRSNQSDPLSYFQIAGNAARTLIVARSMTFLLRQVFTAILMHHMMEFRELVHTLAIVCMRRLRSPCGTGRMLPSMR